MPAPDSYILKLQRAGDHFHTLRTEIERWSKAQPYVITVERDPESFITTYSAEVRAEPPVEFGLFVGDALHNLRGCIDHLTLALAESNHGGRLPPEAEGASQFPVYSSSRLFWDNSPRRIGHIASRPQAVIETLQPYHRGDDWQLHPLWILRELSDYDKHRRLPLIASHAGVDEVVPSVPLDHLTRHPSGELEGKTPIISFRAADGLEVEVNFRLILDVAFSQPSPVAHTSPLEVLGMIGDHIADEVVEKLQPYV